jgi:N-acyl-L-homoserine lactone synthetase
MQILRELKLGTSQEGKTVFFGIPDTEEELGEMFRLRYEVHAAMGELDSLKCPGRIYRDECDSSGTSLYCIAKLNNEIIGAVRLTIKGELLTEKFFQFNKPKELSDFSDNEIGEVYWLSVRSLTKSGDFISWYMTALFLCYCLTDIAAANGIKAAYSFYRKSWYFKLARIKVPVHEFAPSGKNFPAQGPPAVYFKKKYDPVVPLHVFTGETQTHLEKLLANRFLFRRDSPYHWVLLSNIPLRLAEFWYFFAGYFDRIRLILNVGGVLPLWQAPRN